MSLTIRNLSVEQGTDFSEVFQFWTDTDPLGILANATPYNLTGASLKMQVRINQDASSQVLLQFTNTLSAPGLILGAFTFTDGPPLPSNPNGWTFSMTAAQTLTGGGFGGITLSVGNYFYDIMVTIGGSTTCYSRGSFQVVSTVTR